MESNENATVTAATADSPKADEMAAERVVTTTTAETERSSAVGNGPVVVDRETTAVATTAINADGNSAASVDVDELSVAMGCATILNATDAAGDVEQSRGQVVASEVDATRYESVIVADDRVNRSKCELQTPKQTEELNSTVDSVFEDAREYIEESFVEKDDSVVIDAECSKSLDGHDENGEELLDEKNDLDEDKAPTIPVPVDDDTNDPQYIPRRGRFYEHDDRMAYSTSSENTDSDNEHEENSGDDGSVRRLMRRRRATTKMCKTPVIETTENVSAGTGDGTSKRVLAISKVAAVAKSSTGELTKTLSRKSRDMDSLDKWTHDLYDEREQMPKTQDELLVTYGYDIRSELEAPRARRHHKYGRTSTAKYNRNWQDTTAYNGTKTKRRDLHANSPNQNKNKLTTTDNNYTTEFPTLDKTKPSESTAVVESPAALEACSSHHHQQAKSVPTDQEKKIVETVPPRHQVQSSRAPIKHANVNNSHQQKQNGTSLATSSHNKNMFNRPVTEYSAGKEKDTHMNKDFYNRKSSRNFNFNQPQFNRDRNFAKPSFSVYNLPQNNVPHAGTGRTLHSSGGHYNDRQYENENQQITPPPTVVRSSKRYSVQSRRELPNPVLNFGGMPKTNQPQQQISQPNGLVMQEPPTSQIQQQQQQIQIHQPPPPQIQMQPYQQLPQLHHGMVLDHNSSMMVMSDSSIYHHLYAGPQYSAVTPGPASAGVDDQNAAALQMLATQAVVYHPGATPSPPQPPPETFMTTFYQPQQQNNKQLPPRRMNLAIPIVAPPESNQSQSKTVNSSTAAPKN